MLLQFCDLRIPAEIRLFVRAFTFNGSSSARSGATVELFNYNSVI